MSVIPEASLVVVIVLCVLFTLYMIGAVIHFVKNTSGDNFCVAAFDALLWPGDIMGRGRIIV